MRLAYCPWCGAELTPISEADTDHFSDIVWEPCHTRLCKGAMLTLVTDLDGFVIHPSRIRGRYVKTKPETNNM